MTHSSTRAQTRIFGIAMIVIGILASPMEAKAWQIIDYLDNIVGRSRCYPYTCAGPTAVTSIRGSESTVEDHPDGSVTWTIGAGEYRIVNRVTGEVSILLGGNTYEFPPAKTVLPFQYTTESLSGQDTLLRVSFENLVYADVFDVTASLVSALSGVQVEGGTFAIGAMALNATAGPYSLVIRGWDPSTGDTGLTWTVSYRDSSGVLHSNAGIPMLFESYSRSGLVPVPEVSTWSMLAVGLVLSVGAMRRRLRLLGLGLGNPAVRPDAAGLKVGGPTTDRVNTWNGEAMVKPG